LHQIPLEARRTRHAGLPICSGSGAQEIVMGLAASHIDARLTRLPQPVTVEWPGGHAGAAHARLRLKLADRRLLASLAQGRIGSLADAYVQGRCDFEGSLAELMSLAAALVGDPRPAAQQPLLQRLHSLWQTTVLSRLRHTRTRDARQIRQHYDVSDAFYALWLDRSMSYSCAWFREAEMSLEAAQQAKLELICRKLRLEPGLRLLDVGCGWGALLLHAAERWGVHATGITLSRNQHRHVAEQIAARGLAGRVDVHLVDYRDVKAEGHFDRIASIGMFEHVGLARLPAYFATLFRLLRPGGLVLNHGITSAATEPGELGAGMGDFIERHIFPGGELVHVSAAARALAEGGLELVDVENLRPHYARTLWAWSDRLEERQREAECLTSAHTVRAYRLYLAGSAMCFEHGWLALHQVLAARPDAQRLPSRAWSAHSDYPFDRRYMLA
jgi:cyclopropane-fatty-acyl-phospholipid synthase